jgi:hypothetical protein
MSLFGGVAKPLESLSFGGPSGGALGGLLGGAFGGADAATGFDWGGAGIKFGDAFSTVSEGFGQKEGQGFGGALSGILGGLGGGATGGAAGGAGGGGLSGILGIGIKLLGSLFGGGFADGGPIGGRAMQNGSAISAALAREGPGARVIVANDREFILKGSSVDSLAARYGTDFLHGLNNGQVNIPNFKEGGFARGIKAPPSGGTYRTPPQNAEFGIGGARKFTFEYKQIGEDQMVTRNQLDQLLSVSEQRSAKSAQTQMSANMRGSHGMRQHLGMS